MKSGNLNFLEPSRSLHACNGTAVPLHTLQTGAYFASYLSNQHYASAHKRNSQHRYNFTYFNRFSTVNSKICVHLLLQNPYNIQHREVCYCKKVCSTNITLDGNLTPKHPHSLRISKWRNFPSLNIATGRGEEGWKGVEAYSLPLIRSNMVSNLT